MCREEGDTIEGEGLQAARAPRQVKDPDHHTAQAEVDRPTVHDDPVMALFKSRQKDVHQLHHSEKQGEVPCFSLCYILAFKKVKPVLTCMGEAASGCTL